MCKQKENKEKERPKRSEQEGKIYFITNFSEIKIGFTTLSPVKRLKQLNTGSSTQLYLLGYISGTMQTESDLHKRFNSIRVRQNGEWFYGTDDLIDYINQVNEWPNKYVIRNEFLDNKIMAMDTIYSCAT